MKKRILMLTLVLMIVLSSFITSFANVNIPTGSLSSTNANSNAVTRYNYAVNQVLNSGLTLFVIFDNPTIFVTGIDESKNEKLHLSLNGGIYSISNTNTYSLKVQMYATIHIESSSDSNPIIYSGDSIITSEITNSSGQHVSGKFVIVSELPIYGLDYVNRTNTGTQVNNWTNPLVNVSIKPSQRILFNYAPADKDKFLKSLSCTPDKSITVHQAYYSGGQVTDLVIKKDTTDLLIGGAPLTLASFPSHRALNTNEYLGYSQANGGNWVWTDFIPGSSGGPVGTDSNSLVTFTIDTRYCSYRVVSANTGLEITSGGIAEVPQVPDDGIYNNNQNPWGPGDITDDYLLDRADYEDGIIGDIQYGFDTLFKFLKMPFELLYKFIMTLGEIIQYALGTVSGFTTALQGIYAILPGPIWFLVIMAISINVFKLIFGR